MLRLVLVTARYHLNVYDRLPTLSTYQSIFISISGCSFGTDRNQQGYLHLVWDRFLLNIKTENLHRLCQRYRDIILYIYIICINLWDRIHYYFHLINHGNLLRLMMNESEGYPQYYDFYPDWPETQELESVPGFGFLPVGVNKELDMMTQVTRFFINLPITVSFSINIFIMLNST